MVVRALSWNLFHGRDYPPEPELFTWRSRLLGRTERGASHAQVNVDLRPRFESVLAGADWDVALLQECPPRWAERLATACRADPHLVPTSRNLSHLGRVQALIADRNPDLIASWEGGSNLTLVRSASGIAERQSFRLTLRPEQRVMALTRLGDGLCVANLHASADRARAEDELIEAARIASGFAGNSPLILGGDYNLRPALSGPVFDRLDAEHGLRAPTGDRVIDHLLARGLEIVEPAAQWAPERREVPDPTGVDRGGRQLPVRLSDHAPVEALLERRAAD
jgi:endonuclease/exonuclease/phosphatase family metal-dependent hydrolase